ncbi:hypothetical protein GCM10023175_53730 [Pseudonocardia xishanensis]|uniref:Uncharacterized protein n=2 Tax=Pseudonocardiaceae TaxID=2070 RepID=A0ABP8RYR5_9PSEU
MALILSRRVAEPGPSGGAEQVRVAVADMDELIAAGDAQPLLAEFDIGPVWWDRMWWVIPQGEGEVERGYLVAGDADQVELTALFFTLARSAEAVEEGARRREATAQASHADDPAWPYDQTRMSRRRWWSRRR